MYFVLIGVLLLVMKVAEFGAVATWPWWGILLPFGMAVLWWMWADWSGYTKRRAMDRMDERVRKRREESLAKLGMDERGRRGKRR
jgi:small Trp-rich protein